MPLSNDQLAFYAENGYVVVPDIVPPDVLKRIRDAITEITTEAQAGRSKRVSDTIVEPDAASISGATATKSPLRKLNALVPHDPFFRSVASSPAILDVVTQLTG